MLTEGILVYTMYRYGAEPGRKAVYIHGNHKLEFAWTIVPAVILLFIAFAQVSTWERHQVPVAHAGAGPGHAGDAPASWSGASATPTPDNYHGRSEGPERLGQEWPNADIDDVHVVNEVHTWKGANVKIYLKTHDVIHSFFLPNLRLKQDALPGKTIPVWFNATRGQHRVGTATTG